MAPLVKPQFDRLPPLRCRPYHGKGLPLRGLTSQTLELRAERVTSQIAAHRKPALGHVGFLHERRIDWMNAPRSILTPVIATVPNLSRGKNPKVRHLSHSARGRVLDFAPTAAQAVGLLGPAFEQDPALTPVTARRACRRTHC